MRLSPGITHNIQPREEIAYIVPESELELLGSLNFTATLLISLAGALGSIAVTTAVNASSPWTATECAIVFGSLFAAIALIVWCRRETLVSKSLIARIKRRPKPKRDGDANAGGDDTMEVG